MIILSVLLLIFAFLRVDAIVRKGGGKVVSVKESITSGLVLDETTHQHLYLAR